MAIENETRQGSRNVKYTSFRDSGQDIFEVRQPKSRIVGNTYSNKLSSSIPRLPSWTSLGASNQEANSFGKIGSELPRLMDASGNWTRNHAILSTSTRSSKSPQPTRDVWLLYTKAFNFWKFR